MSTAIQESRPEPSRFGKPRVGVIGRGKVGSAIKRGLERAGYEVRAVGKEPKQVTATAAWAEVLVLAVPYSAIGSALTGIGANADGKALVDATNPLSPSGLALGYTTSGAEEIQKKLPRAKVVKAFNITFASHMDSGMVKGKQLVFLAAGDDKEAKSLTLQLGSDIGFDSMDAGPLSSARWLEAMAYQLILMAFSFGMGTDIGYSLVH